jgi:hypothetical protein
LPGLPWPLVRPGERVVGWQLRRRYAIADAMRPQKITFGEMREMGVRGVLVYCADYTCSHSVTMDAGAWPDDLRLSDIEDRFVCQRCGRRGADVRPDFPSPKMGS